MKTILTVILAASLASTASAQVLSEDFSTGVPPTGWTHIDNNGAAGQGWIADASGRAWHEDEYLAGLSSDNTLVSPVFDLTAITGTTLTFESETHYSAYLATNPLGYGDGASTMEITTDGGLTWTQVWTDVTTVDYVVTTEGADLSAFDGMANVQLGIHFFGTYAQEWWVDNIVVAAGAAPFQINSGYFPAGGWGWVNISGATPNGNVVLGISASTGSTMSQYGLLGIALPIAPWYEVADAHGNLKVTHHVNVMYTGGRVHAQAVDVTTGILSNVFQKNIQ